MEKNAFGQNIKKRHSLFTRWEFDAAAEEFNRMSEQGWHVTEVGFYTQTYVYNPNLKYRYQIDYNHSITDPVRYYESFADAGWIPVKCKGNDWHVFAREYADGNPEEAYMIYTDGQSKAEMYRRARCFVGIAAIIWIFCLAQGIYSAISAVAASSNLAFMEVWTPVLQVLNVYLFSRWYFSVRSLEKGKKPRRFHYFAFVTVGVTVIILSMGSILLNSFGVM